MERLRPGSLALADVLADASFPLLAAIMEDSGCSEEPEHGQGFMAWPRHLAENVKAKSGQFVGLLSELVGHSKASDAMADLAADRTGNRSVMLWQPSEEAHRHKCLAMELRVLKPKGGSRQFVSLCAALQPEARHQGSLGPLDTSESLHLRNRLDRAHSVLAEFVAASRNRPFDYSGSCVCCVPAIRFRAELHDQEAFSSSSMASAKLSAALVSLSLPAGMVSLAAGIYFAQWEDLGAILAVKTGGSVAVSAELSLFRRDHAEVPELVDVDDVIDDRGSAGQLTNFCWLRPFYYGLVKTKGPGQSHADLQKQVGLDASEAAKRLWPSRSSVISPRTQVPCARNKASASQLPLHLFQTELLSFVTWLELPVWAATSRSSRMAALRFGPAAMAQETLVYLPGAGGGQLQAAMMEVLQGRRISELTETTGS